jgi:hypothetical protein
MTARYIAQYASAFKQTVVALESNESFSVTINGLRTFSQAEVDVQQDSLRELLWQRVNSQRPIRNILVLGADHPAMAWMLARVFPDARFHWLSEAPKQAAKLLGHPYFRMYAEIPGTVLGEHTLTIGGLGDATTLSAAQGPFDLIVFALASPLSQKYTLAITALLDGYRRCNPSARYLVTVFPSGTSSSSDSSARTSFRELDAAGFDDFLQRWAQPSTYVELMMNSWFGKHCRYPYAPNTLLIEYEDLPRAMRAEAVFAECIEHLSSQYDIVVYVRETQLPIKNCLIEGRFVRADYTLQRWIYRYDASNYQTLQRWAKRLPFDVLFSRSRVLWCEPAADPDLSALMQEYLASHAGVFFDRAADKKNVLNHRALFYLYYSAAGEPIGMVKVLCHSAWREAEIVFCKGSAKQNLAVMVYSFIEDFKVGAESIEINVPYSHVASVLQKLGAISDASYDVYTRMMSVTEAERMPCAAK